METFPTIRSRLPAYDTLTPFDSENKWILTASAVVFNGNDPEQMQKGVDELLEAKSDFEGCFDFQTPAVDTRHIFDTRVKS
jgi:mediator of RNA polymerase II transcription subunit 18